jgi:hypothetical protein
MTGGWRNLHTGQWLAPAVDAPVSRDHFPKLFSI